MGIKKNKLLRLGQKLLPIKIKHVLVKYNIIKGMEDTQALVWSEDNILEFWLDGFNDGGLEEAFSHIMKLYDMYLKDDVRWHFIYEGNYTLIRCSYKYVPDLVKYFTRNEIRFRSPAWWTEGTHVTAIYKEIFTEIFHWTSVLAIEMAKNKEEDFHIQQSADRIVHVFLLQALYLADINGSLDELETAGFGVMYWESSIMSNLAKYRTYHIGTIDGHNRLKAHWDKVRKENEEKENSDKDDSL